MENYWGKTPRVGECLPDWPNRILLKVSQCTLTAMVWGAGCGVGGIPLNGLHRILANTELWRPSKAWGGNKDRAQGQEEEISEEPDESQVFVTLFSNTQLSPVVFLGSLFLTMFVLLLTFFLNIYLCLPESHPWLKISELKWHFKYCNQDEF